MGIKLLILFGSIILSSPSFSQKCDLNFTIDKFTKDKKINFTLDGDENSIYTQPFIQLTIHISGNEDYQRENLRIQLSAGTGKSDFIGIRDYSSLTTQFAAQENNSLQLYFLFEDGKSIYLMGSSQVVFGNSVYMIKSKQQELLHYFKTKRVTDIRFIYNTIQADYKLPEKKQDFFKRVMTCINW
jgi:hypothetical protein